MGSSHPGMAEAVMRYSRYTYGRNVAVVANLIRERFTMPVEQRFSAQ
jgi:hypothetical protein